MTMTENAARRTVIGQRLLRKEDPALLTGEARYTNDSAAPGALHNVRNAINAARNPNQPRNPNQHGGSQ